MGNSYRAAREVHGGYFTVRPWKMRYLNLSLHLSKSPFKNLSTRCTFKEMIIGNDKKRKIEQPMAQQFIQTEKITAIKYL